VLFVPAEASFLQVFCAQRSQPERFIEFAVGEQPGIHGDLTTEEFQLQPAVETDPQIALLAITHWVPRSAWHALAESPWFSGVWRKSHAEDRELIWEMRVQ
jgi:hypothetical protein